MDMKQIYKLPIYNKVKNICQGNAMSEKALFGFVAQGYHINSIENIISSLSKYDIVAEKVYALVHNCCQDNYVKLINTMPIITEDVIDIMDITKNLVAEHPVALLDEEVAAQFVEDVEDIPGEAYEDARFKAAIKKSFKKRFKETNGIELDEIQLLAK